MDYYCSECDMVIREEDVVRFKQESEAWGHKVYEDWLLCPKCNEPVSEFMGEPYENKYGD